MLWWALNFTSRMHCRQPNLSARRIIIKFIILFNYCFSLKLLPLDPCRRRLGFTKSHFHPVKFLCCYRNEWLWVLLLNVEMKIDTDTKAQVQVSDFEVFERSEVKMPWFYVYANKVQNFNRPLRVEKWKYQRRELSEVFDLNCYRYCWKAFVCLWDQSEI